MAKLDVALFDLGFRTPAEILDLKEALGLGEPAAGRDEARDLVWQRLKRAGRVSDG